MYYHICLIICSIIGLYADGGIRIRELEFNAPGSYMLMPRDYHNSSQIIFEIWGAGSGGNVWNGGGGGGSYIKANVRSGLRIFKIIVGSGGKGVNTSGCRFPSYYGESGGFSSVTSLDELNLIAGGGNMSNNWSGIGGKVISVKGAVDYISKDGYNGQYSIIYGMPNEPNENNGGGGNGGASGFGGSGGQGNSLDPPGPGIPEPGYYPGGGGGAINTHYQSDPNCYTAGNGADGKVSLYFISQIY